MATTTFLILAAFAALANAELNCVCAVNSEGEIKTYDDTHLVIHPDTTEKSLLSRWDGVPSDPCKFKLRMVPFQGRISWIGFGVGVHGVNSDKFWRNFAIDRYAPGRLEVRGWQIEKAESISDQMPYHWQGGDTQVSVYGSFDTGYVINSTTCPYELIVNPHADDEEAHIQFSISKAKYQTSADMLRGLCMNCNNLKYDDYTVCRTGKNVRKTYNALKQISEGCWDNDKDQIPN